MSESESETPQIDDSTTKLIQKIVNDPSLAKKLGLFLSQDEGSKGIKRKDTGSHSPVKLKQVKKGNCSKDLPGGRSPNRIAPAPETSDNGATPADSQSGKDTLESESEEDANEKLEEILNRSFSDHNNASDNDHSDNDEFEIMGDKPSPSWSPSQKSLDWFLKVADLDLNKEIISQIQEDYKGSDSLETHFEPPRFPSALWSAVQNNHADVFRLKVILKAQENLYLAIKPLLAAADNSPKPVRSEILKAIQLICASNLSLNRFRRSTIAPHLKSDLKKQLLSLPIKHNTMFGEEFGKVTDNLIKENSVVEKILAKKSSFPKFKAKFQKNTSSPGFRGGRGGKSYHRGKQRGKRALLPTPHPMSDQPYPFPSKSSNAPSSSSNQ